MLWAMDFEGITTKPFSKPSHALFKCALNVIFHGSLRSLEEREQSKQSNSIPFDQGINYLYLKFSIIEWKGKLAAI